MSSLYAERTLARWPQSRLQVSRCVAVVELVNLPSKFESVSPHFVVQQLDWIIWFVCIFALLLYYGDIYDASSDFSRYLLVRCGSGDEQPQRPLAKVKVPFVNLDPKHPIKLSKKALKIPEPDHKLQTLLTARTTEYVEQDYDEDDMKVFEGDNSNVLSQISNVQPSHASRRLALRQHMMSGYFEPRFQNQGHEHRLELKSTAQNQDQDQDQDQVPDEEKDPWKHDSAWVKECLSYVLSPPTDALPMATMALQKELKAVLRDQDAAKSLKQLGWYMPVEYIGDNLFQWIIELHSFEEDLPIAKDMKRL